ncbi:breast cancer type 2 susceptibility protein-like isoform X2 [Montipora capricornis]|uniref:breast cancer type 2 susceptibility protein-like isoform X2 n=1 Tax=Montipora capricornis TaxID=246305 RepID=UPI0035F159A5
MEPFIQLNYAEQCPRQSLEIKETPFVDTTKVSELFWIDLLKAKCVEGLGEVSENLLNDENLTPDDFIDDQHVSAVISGILKNNGSCNNCLVPSKSGDCKELKTPVASKYVHKSFETPCLFSQDESVNVTPLTSPGHVTIKSQSRCDEDSQTGQGSSISDSQVLHTPASLSCYSRTYDWRKRTTKTPDALAEIMGRGKSSLSFLLAGSDDDEVTEWSESMATPPLKITRPAANIDETDDEVEDAVDKFEGDECNPTSKRIARVLFYGSTNNQSIQPLEVSLDDAVTSNQLLDIDFHGNAIKPEEKAEDTSIHDEFIPEDSCCSNSKCEGENISKSFPLETLLASPSITSSGNNMAESGDKITTTSFDDISRSRCSKPAHKQSGIHFPFTDNFLSPSCRIPLKALAQSTPKPVVSSVFDAVQDGKKEGDSNLSGSASSFQGCEKTPSKALYDVSCLASEHTDVTFGSPSRSFELAMARETDKHSSKLERDTRTSGLGSSISPVSPHLEGAFNDTGIVQPTEVSHQENGAKMKQDNVTLSTAGTLIKHGNEGTTKMTSKQPRKPMTVSLMKKDLGTEISHNLVAENQATEENPSTELSCVTLTRKKSFCKAPGLRRSVRTKRFLCPTANQRSNEDSTKRFKAEGSSIDESAVLKKDNLGAADIREDARCDDEKNMDDKVVCILSCGVGKGGLNLEKKGKLPTENGCDHKRAITETKEYEDDLIDMDSLSQFPVDCLLSPPYLKYSSVLSNAPSSSSVERLQCKMNVTYTVLKEETQTSLKEFESYRSCSRDDLDLEGDKNSIGKTENSLSREKEEDVFAEPFSSPKLNTSPLPADLTKGENTDKILDKGVKAPVSSLKESESRKELSAPTFISRECEQSMVDLNNVFNRLEKSKGNTTDESKIFDMHAIPGKSASSESGGNCASTADDVEKFCMDMSNSSTLKSAKNDGISSEIVGFHTASGKRVSVSLEALAKAKTALEQVDISLGLHKGPSGVRLQSSGEQVKLSERSVKQADEINVNSPDSSERKNLFEGRKSCSSVPDELENFMIGRQREPFTSSGNDLVSTLTGYLDKAYRELDSYESDTKVFETSSRPESYSGENLCQAKGQRIVQIGETAVLNVGDIESKPGAFVNDSLLEDLLNDCKMKRRDSLESILIKQSEKTVESLKEGKRGNNDSELNGSSSTSCNQEVLERRENVTPALRGDVWSRNKSTFESDDMSFFPGNGNGTNTEEKVSGAEIPSPKNTSNYRTTSRNAVLQTASGMLAKISQHSSQGASSNMKKINEELFDDEQSYSKRGYLGFCEMQSAYKEPNADSNKESPTIRDSRTSDGSVSTESPPKKTVNSFPGFLTAGGKKVALSEESLKAGRDIMRRLTEDEVISCTLPCHLVNVETYPVSKRDCEADVSMQARGNLSEKRDCNTKVHIIPLAESVDADKNSFNQNHLLEDKNKKQSLEFFGFQTASGKRVGLSKEALQKGAVIMDQIDRSLNQNEEQRALNNPSLSHFHCFQTAEGRSVKLSNESVKKGVIIMQQIDRSLGGGPEEITAAGECGVSSFHSEVRERLNKPQKFPGKEKADVQVLDESQAEERNKNKVNSPLCPGFQTAAGRSVKISKESLQKGAAIMQQIDKSLDFIEEGRRFASGNSGLQNDNEQSVKRVRDSLCIVDAMKQEGEKVLKEIKANSSTNSDSASFFPGFRRANEQGAALSKESIAREATMTQPIDKSLVENVESITSASCGATCIAGFRTASGQSVKLSKESLRAGEAIMREIDNCLHREIKGDDRSKSCNVASSSSFQTTGGQSLKLSEESLAKEVARMPEIDNFLIEDNKVSSSWDTSSFTGFQTASGQNVRLSKNSLEKGAQIMRHIDRSLELKADDVGSCSSPTFCGFQTACGKTVQISESALSKGKETMAVIDKEIRSMSLRSEYRDIVSKSTEQEKSALEESCNGRVLVEECKDEGTFKGFFTAGGSSVSVSEKALAKAKELLLETDIAVDGSKLQQMASLKESSIPLITIDPKKSRTADDDDDVSREVLESSKALLADESFLDVSEYLPDKHDQCSATRTPLETSASRSLLLERQQRKNHEDVASVSKAFQPMHHSTPLRCSEEEFRSNHSWTRNGMKPYATTPSGILHDRRTRSFHVQLRARQSSFEHINTLGFARSSVANRSLKPLKASSPGFFKAKINPLPRTSTPVNPNTSHRTIPSPRPPFVTPYRRQRACKDVSPLTRTSASTGFPVDESLEGELSAAITEPSPKKAKLSAPNSAFNASSTPGGGYKVSELNTPTNYKTKPQPGFLSQLRRRGQRIRLKEFVGNATPGGYKADELIELGVKQELLSVTPFNATSFRFKGDTYFSEAALCDKKGVRTEDGGIVHVGADGGVGLEEIQSAFLCTPGVDRELISDGWIANHYRWLVWKLAAMEVSFPRHFAGRCLTPDWLLCQMKYRYDREVDHSNRSALKKVMERDDAASRTMILCVSSVWLTDDASVPLDDSKKEGSDNDNLVNKKTEQMPCAVIELTDGWYSIRGLLDGPLTRLLRDKRLIVGQKLCIHGAELVGSDQAVSPLEAPSSLMLRLHANSTRRARWDAKLGFHRHMHAFPLPLASLYGDGGFTGCVDIIVLRQYPLQWMEKMSDGTNIFRNSRLEEREAKKFEEEHHRRREKLFIKIQEEFEKEIEQPERRRSARFRCCSFSSNDVKGLFDGKEIYEALTQGSDPDALRQCLDERQVRALEGYKQSLQEKKCAELQSKFERVWKEQTEKGQFHRNAIPLLKVRINDYSSQSQAKQSALLSIWRPSEEVMQLLCEGSRLRIYHLTTAGVRSRYGNLELQLSATRTTRYEALPSDPDGLRSSYLLRQVCSFDELRCRGSSPHSLEVDMVGLVVFCSPLSSTFSSSSSVQTVYLSDEKNNVVAVKFWGGLQAFAVDDLVKPRCFICCSNLTIRPDDRLHQCTSLAFNELSSLTMKPRELHLRNALHKLQQNIPDVDEFMAGIQETLTSLLHPHRSSPPADVQVNTVRMYGNVKDRAPPALNAITESTDKENCSNFKDGDDDWAGVTQTCMGNDSSGETQEQRAPSFENCAALSRTQGISSRALDRQVKRKLLDSIAEPPPLLPLHSPIPVSVRRDFKRPRSLRSSKLPLEH